jgi:hypothetical protein
MIGFEIEISRLVADKNGAKIDGDEELGTAAVLPFDIVTDSQQGYSNIEFVSEPRSVVDGGRLKGPKDLKDALAGMKAVTAKLAAAKGVGTFKAVTAGLVNTGGEGDTAKLLPYPKGFVSYESLGGDGLGPQYTVGARLGALASFFDFLRTNVPFSDEYEYPSDRARFRLAQAEGFGKELAKIYKKTVSTSASEIAQVNGYAQLVYTQVAAMADYLIGKKDEGQVKNGTVGLCRSRFSEIFPLLPQDVRDFFTAGFSAKNDNFVTLIASYQEVSDKGDERLPFNEDNYRAVPDPYAKNKVVKTTLIEYTKSALTGEPSVGQQSIFGGMKMIAPKRDGAGFVIPIEVRTFGTTLFKTWVEVAADLDLIIGWVQSAK